MVDQLPLLKNTFDKMKNGFHKMFKKQWGSVKINLHFLFHFDVIREK